MTSVWLTGVPASGKSTLARALGRRLAVPLHIVDGDELRRELGHYDFSPSGRLLQARAAVAICKAVMRFGVVSIAALVCPLREHRELVRRAFEGDQVTFFLVLVTAPEEVLALRRADRGQFLGDAVEYELPGPFDAVVDTSKGTEEDCATDLVRQLGLKEMCIE